MSSHIGTYEQLLHLSNPTAATNLHIPIAASHEDAGLLGTDIPRQQARTQPSERGQVAEHSDERR